MQLSIRVTTDSIQIRSLADVNCRKRSYNGTFILKKWKKLME
ncbi:hypothetical protein ERO13_D13G227450v2 [Gossypium hirsutum]|nr:hypothetical protein ERO13_D13G227450v2 [Gossypium hirsutum]